MQKAWGRCTPRPRLPYSRVTWTAITCKMSVVVPERVIVHPLVLLSVVDHYNRVSKETKKRTVGVLLGQWIGNTVNVANSFAGF